jgi:hypothetical protein
MAERDPEYLYRVFMGDRYESVEYYVRNRTQQRPQPQPKVDAIDAALQAELEADAPPAGVEEVEPVTMTQSAEELAAARLEHRRRALEAGFIRAR